MSDIVKRLRDAVDRSEHWSDDYHQDESLWAVAREAADQMESLTDAYNSLYARYWNLSRNPSADT